MATIEAKLISVSGILRVPIVKGPKGLELALGQMVLPILTAGKYVLGVFYDLP